MFYDLLKSVNHKPRLKLGLKLTIPKLETRGERYSRRT